MSACLSVTLSSPLSLGPFYTLQSRLGSRLALRRLVHLQRQCGPDLDIIMNFVVILKCVIFLFHAMQ